MSDKLVSWKSLNNDFEVVDIIDGFLAALLYATLLFIPVMLVFIELITINLYLLTLLSLLIIIALFGYIIVIHLFWKKSLLLKNPACMTNIKKLFIRSTIIVNIVILIVGLIFIFVIMPILFV